MSEINISPDNIKEELEKLLDDPSHPWRQPNWDNQGAAPADIRSIPSLLSFLDMIDEESMPLPYDIMVTAGDGEVKLCWWLDEAVWVIVGSIPSRDQQYKPAFIFEINDELFDKVEYTTFVEYNNLENYISTVLEPTILNMLENSNESDDELEEFLSRKKDDETSH